MQRWCFGEADDAKVAGMNGEQQPGLCVDRRLVVLQPGAVGGAHLDEPCSTLPHDIWHTEATADLYEPAARTNPPASRRQCRQHEQPRSSVVVDCQRIRRSGQLTYEVAHMNVPGAALSRLQIKLQICVAMGYRGHSRD